MRAHKVTNIEIIHICNIKKKVKKGQSKEAVKDSGEGRMVSIDGEGTG